MIPVPNRKTIIAAFIPLFIIMIGFIYHDFMYVAILFDTIIFFVLVLDALLSILTSKIEIETDKSSLFSIGRINHFNISVRNKSKKPAAIQFRPALPQSFEIITQLKTWLIEPMGRTKLFFEVKPLRRGTYDLEFMYYKFRSKFGLLDIFSKAKINASIEVYPDIKKLTYFLKLMRTDRISSVGIYRNKFRGLGIELESLRDYQKDDDSRYIDWKATTRLNRPITKIFQSETHNQITIAIDCGRLMTAEQDGINTLDHAVNSLLMLAHIAFRVEDTISVIAFSDKIIGELPEIKSKAGLNKITRFITKLKPQYVESNYSLVFKYLQKKLNKRSLVIFLTDLIDDVNYEIFKKGIHVLSKKHLVLFVLLRDILLTQHAEKKIHVVDDLYHRTAAQEMFLRRNNAITRLRQKKIQVMDVLPQELNSQLINKYLELKAKNRL